MDRGRHQNIVANDGFSYVTRWTKNNTRYLVCRNNRQLGCTATGKITLDDIDGADVAQFVLLNARHNHPREDNLIEGVEFKKELRAACIRDRGTLKNIYEHTATRNVDGAVYVPFNSIRSSMLRWRQLTTPNIPGSLVELAEIFQSGIATANKHHAVIFGNQDFIANFTDSQCTFIDGTFKSVPRRPNFGQILTVFASCMDHAFPIIHVFMERRTKPLYDAVFEYLSLTFPHFVNQNVVTDYEMALIESLRAAYPQASLHGCFFHFCQAVLRKAKALGIVRQIEGNANGRLFLRKYYALAEMIEPTLISLQEDMEFGATFEDLNGYVGRQWIGRVTPEHFSVFRQRHRTNNVMESYHRRLNSKLVRHPGVWDLMETLIDIQDTALIELAQLERGPDNRVFRIAKKNVLFNSQLNEAWQKLSDGRVTTRDFLRQAVHFVEGLDRQLHDWHANIEDNDEEPVLALLQPPLLVPLALPPLVPLALPPLVPLAFPPLIPLALPPNPDPPLLPQLPYPILNQPPPLIYFQEDFPTISSPPPPDPSPPPSASPPPSPSPPQSRSPSPPLNQGEFEGGERELPIYNFPPIPGEVAALFAQLGDDGDAIVVPHPIVRRWEPTSTSSLFNEDTMSAVLRCPVCYQYEIRYVVECGHAFCPGCMDRLFNHEAAKCGICRTDLNREPTPLFLG